MKSALSNFQEMARLSPDNKENKDLVASTLQNFGHRFSEEIKGEKFTHIFFAYLV